MSVFVDSHGKFNNYYSLCIISPVENYYDLLPLKFYLQRINKPIIFISNPTYKFFEVFSPTLYNINADYCKSIVNNYKKNNLKIFPYKNLRLETYKKLGVKSLAILDKFYIEIENTHLEIVNFEIRINIIFSKKTLEKLSYYRKKLIKLWETRRKFRNYIIIGYIYNNDFTFLDSEIDQINKLIPSKLLFNPVKFGEFWNIENYKDIKFE